MSPQFQGGLWLRLRAERPRLLLAGRNPVCLDAVATTVMGYDPQASPGTGAFPEANHLALAAERQLGTIDLREIEVLGLPVTRALYPFRWEPPRVQ